MFEESALESWPTTWIRTAAEQNGSALGMKSCGSSVMNAAALCSVASASLATERKAVGAGAAVAGPLWTEETREVIA